MREVMMMASLLIILLWWATPPEQGVGATGELQPAASKAEIVTGNPVLAGFYATGDVWCFQSSACQHLGTDLSADYDSPVYAPYTAVVTMVGAYYDPARAGQYVIMELQDGCSLYLGHLQSVTVAAGQPVTAGSLLGFIGPENHAALGWPGPHTHVQLSCGGILQDWEAYDAQRY